MVGFCNPNRARTPIRFKPRPGLAGIGVLGRVRHSLPLGFAALRLETRVEPGLLRVRLVPLNHLRIPIHTIRHAEVVTYHPFRDFGGWGLRWSGKGRALNAYGSRGCNSSSMTGAGFLWALSGPTNC